MKPRGFHRSDFTGSAGPGLAKLRAARPSAEPMLSAIPLTQTATGRERVRAEMDAGNWREAILAAAKFPDLGDERDAILSGREAIVRPAFQRQLKRDPEALIEVAKAALRRRYGAA